jgi:hypothetical protein
LSRFKRDELQNDAPPHQGLAGICAAPPNHVPQTKEKHGRDRRKR